MKTPTISLAVTDLDPELGKTIVDRFYRIAFSPRHRVLPNGLLGHDWRRVAVRYLRRTMPQAWCYVGGRHIAIHASAPREETHGLRAFKKQESGAAGKCLARIVEAS